MSAALVAGRGGEPCLHLSSADGAQADIYAHGAHLTSWRPAGGSDQLYLSDRAIFAPGSSIRGGVPVIFPQFNKEGPLPKHGFARSQNWMLAEHDDGHARWVLEQTAESFAQWPHRFRCELAVSIGGAALSVELSVTNTGDSAFTFTGALHSYLHVDEIADVRIQGLRGLQYRDAANGNAQVMEASDAVAIVGEVDRVYHDAPASLLLLEPARRLRVAQSGFTDTVVWNPGAKLAATMADMQPDDYRHMLCIEAAAIARPIRLAPGARWAGAQMLTALPG